MSKMYTGSGRVFQEISPLPMDEEGLEDIRRRVKLQPKFLGEPLVVIAEAEDFPAICPPGDDTLIAVDSHGRCAAISISIGTADIERQTSTLLLAANLASLTGEELGRIARNFIDRPANEPLRRLWEDMDVEMSDDSVELASLLAAAFDFLGEMLPAPAANPPAAATPKSAFEEQLRTTFLECVQKDDAGQLRFSVSLPDASFLEKLSAALARALTMGKTGSQNHPTP